MRTRKVGVVVSGALVLVIAVSLLVGIQRVQATVCTPPDVCWQAYASPNPSSNFNTLKGVYAVSNKHVWAVGYYLDTTAQVNKPLIEEWSSTSNTWATVPAAVTGTGGALNAVGFARNDLQATDVWAVGYYTTSTATKTLIEKHGTSWSVVGSPNPTGSSYSVLQSVAGVAANNYWAVGYYYDSSAAAYRTLTEHWDGLSWTIATSDNHGSGNNYLSSVSFGASGEAWATGYYNSSDGYKHPLMLKWSSSLSKWEDRTNDLPTMGNNSVFNGISFNDPSGWAVGYDGNGALIFSYDSANGWANRSPSNGPSLLSVDDMGANAAWAVGWRSPGCCSRPDSEYWNGFQWTEYWAKSIGGFGDTFNAVSGANNTDVWAVGESYQVGHVDTLIERYNPIGQ